MTPLQKVIQEARLVTKLCTIPCCEEERFQVIIKHGSYESIRRLARAIEAIDK
jgi:hypothetical protein